MLSTLYCQKYAVPPLSEPLHMASFLVATNLTFSEDSLAVLGYSAGGTVDLSLVQTKLTEMVTCIRSFWPFYRWTLFHAVRKEYIIVSRKVPKKSSKKSWHAGSQFQGIYLPMIYVPLVSTPPGCPPGE